MRDLLEQIRLSRDLRVDVLVMATVPGAYV
jgi:hypothetical protein